MTAPSSREVLDRILIDMRGELHTCFPAQVLAYDAAEQTVDVRPALLREVGSDDVAEPIGFEQLPDLLNVPYMSLRSRRYGILLPVEPGDWVMVLCAEQSTLLWRSRGTAPTHPGICDPHGLNGCVAIPGWFPDKEKLQNVSSTDLVIGHLDGGSTIRVQADGSVVIGTVEGSFPVARADKVEAELNAIKATLGSLTGGSNTPAAFTKPYTNDPNVGAERVRVK